MGLLNYTTKISVATSVAEVCAMLAQAKANAITQHFDGAGNVTAIEFSIATEFGQMGFRLPADPTPVIATLKRQALARQIPRRFAHDVAQARRVAWRIVRAWTEAQLAIIQLSMVKPEQVFLPYAINPQTGQTVYEMMIENKFERLALPSPMDYEKEIRTRNQTRNQTRNLPQMRP